MRAKLKRLTIRILVTLLIITSLPISAIADDGIGDNDNTGGGSGSYSTGSQFTWTSTQSGYRFAIVDKNFNQVSNTVDLVFGSTSMVTNTNDWYKTSRAKGSDKKGYIKTTFDQILANPEFKGAPYPPTPIKSIIVNGEEKLVAQGYEFKKWFLNGEGSISKNYNTPRPSVSYKSNPSITSEVRKQVDEVAKSSADKVEEAAEDYKWKGRGSDKGGHWVNDNTWEVETTPKPEENKPGFFKSIVNGTKNIINNVWNFIKGIFGGKKSSSLDNYNGQTYALSTSNSTIISSEELEQIPLADSDKGYAREILNGRGKDGQFLFKLPGTDVNDESKWVTAVMIANDYSVIVEPIFWFRPAAWANGGIASPIHPNYVYGTVANHIEFNAKQGYKFGSTGGAYGKLTSSLGWSSMYVGKNWPDTNTLIRTPSITSGTQRLSSLLGMLNSNEGIAMHIYNTSDIIPDSNDRGPTPPPPPTSTTNTNDLILEQSEISKYISTRTSNVPNWGPANFTFNYESMNDSDVHYCGGCQTDSDGDRYCPGHSCNARFGDSAYRYIIENSAAINDKLEANSAGGVFASKMVNNVKSGNASLGGGSDTLNTSEYQTVIWRGQDVPTIASYKENPSIELRALLGKYGKTPVGSRGKNGFYTLEFLANLALSGSSDLQTHSVHSYTGGIWHTSTHVASPSDISYEGDVLVGIYRGLNDKSIGNDTNTNQLMTITPFGGVTSFHSAGYMVQSSTPIKFYPYIRMTYQTNAGSTKHNVNILSEYISEILPNDFAEAAWYNDNESESLTMSSTQWSLHAKAIDSSKTWGGRNQVLPGGAIYQLSTKAHTSQVALITWQTIVEDNIRNMLSNSIPANEYTLAKSTTEHDKYVAEAKDTLENLQIVQWVNSDPSATNAWSANGKALKITQGGQSLSALGLSGSTSTEAKYRLGKDTAANAGNEGDIDVISENKSQDTFFKVFAAPDGKVYLAKSIGSLDALKNVSGTNPTGSGSVTVTQILDKADDYSTVSSRLTGDAKQLNDRTMVVTNLVKALERNNGDDPTATWVSDGQWYNEAFDGIVVVRKATTLTVGLNKPGIRSAVLDPKLCPPNSGKSDMFSKAFLSQFRLDEKSSTATAQGKAPGFIGTFKGKDIRLPEMQDMYQSKKFYIPNVNVQDLN
ncbi:hypothetical protein SAMN05443428_13019 [Caloramator quimbayensis]|uniref:Uncharacterized protein n=1 Tax=Caloramator quimbayensis TaxID=1147123 RepID=A0A1T4Y9X2_9CLOT|nr:hypothetical protein [Caloramator quimbayensis]SKA98617.1 hypothetical protein SAMN05443428_13019 [Caloramator quimbayensis]